MSLSLSLCFCFITFLILFSSVANTTTIVANTTTTVANTSHRRILHLPLFPATQTPPPSPPPSPPSNSDNPFFQDNPNGITNTNTPAAPAAGVAANTTATHPIAPQPANKPAKKIAVVISVGIVTLGMLSALAFFIYKHKKSKQQTESTKVNTMAEYICNNNNNNNNNNGGSPTPSTFLYIGTVEPSRALTDSTNGVNGSPYNKLNPVKRSDRYRPSPELQPLPPLTKPRPPPTPPTPQPDTSSSDE